MCSSDTTGPPVPVALLNGACDLPDTMSAALEAMDGTLDAMAAFDLDDVAAATLGGQVIALSRRIARLQAQWLRRLERFDRAGGAAADGSASTVAWLRHACREAPGDAATHVACARRLADVLPATAAAFAEGEISYRHAAVLTRATADIHRDQISQAEPALLDAARKLNPHQLRTLATHWRHVIDADASGHDEQATYARRRLSISTTLGGTVVLDGELPPEDGAVVLSALQALAVPLPNDERTPTQRRADALVQLARQALDGGRVPERGGVRPHITVTLDFATLMKQSGSPAATTEWGGPISAETARRMACDAGVTRVITKGPSEILDVGRRTRTVPAALRTALVIRDGGCTHPTCDRPASWCDAHHKRHWADGGATNMQNLTLLCPYHHRLAHEGVWRIPPPREPATA